MRWPKYWSFSFSIIPSKEIPGLISFRMDWLDPLASECRQRTSGTQKSSPTLRKEVGKNIKDKKRDKLIETESTKAVARAWEVGEVGRD